MYPRLYAALVSVALSGGLARAQPAEDGVFAPPVLLERVAADYPADAARSGSSGVVVLELEVGSDGVVGSVKLTASAGHGFDEAATAAVRKFRFSPAKKDGVAIPSRVTYSYKFVLKTVAAPKPVVSQIRIQGQVKLRGDRIPLAGGKVFAVDSVGHRTDSDTDDEGRFVLRDLASGKISLVITGPHAKRMEVTEKLGDRELLTVSYFVDPSQYGRYESTVRGDVNREEISRQTLSTEELMKLPGSFGDALRAIENFPGVARAPFNSGLIIVRGGKPTDSKVYLGASEVPQLFHFGGLTSVIPTRLISEIEFMPGNFGVRYGRATAGTIDVELKEGRRDRWHGSAELNVFDAGATAEGPVGKGSMYLAARRSYVDAVLALVLPSNAGVQFQSAPVYYDYQAVFDYPVAGGHLKVMALGSDDALKLVFGAPSDGDPALTNFGTHIYFHKGQIRYTKSIGRWQLFAQLAGGYSGQEGAVGRDLRYSIGVGTLDSRVEVRRPLGHGLKLLLGLDASYSHVDLNLTVPPPTREGQTPSPISANEKQTEHDGQDLGQIGLFAELNWKPSKRVSITPGLRFDWYSALRRTTFDPRMSAQFQLFRYTTLKLGVGHYSQTPQSIDYNRVFGNPTVQPEHAIHTALSVEQGLLPGLSAEVTGFYKHLYDLSTTSNGYLRNAAGVVPERVASIGTGRVYGLEVLLRQSVSKYFFGWVSYTLMKSERSDCPGCGERLFDYDQTHILIVALHGYLPRGWELGLRFRYISGFPGTPPYGGYYDADSDVYGPARGPVNTTRLEDFHSLDFRVDKAILFKTWTLKLYLDILNVYNHLNQEVVQPSFDYSRTQAIRGLPIIPSFGIRAEL